MLEFLQRHGEVKAHEWVAPPPQFLFRKIGPKTQQVRRPNLRPNPKSGGYPDLPGVSAWGITPISVESAAKLAALSAPRRWAPALKAPIYARVKHLFGRLDLTAKYTGETKVLDPIRAEFEDVVILDVVVIGKKAFEALSDEDREKLIKEAQPLRDEIIAAGRPRVW